MGGKIWLDPENEKGASFYFTIPYEKSTLVNVVDSKKTASEKLTLDKRKKVLVAEDIDSNFKLLTYFLSGSNIEILRAMNGKEAVDICLSVNDIDLILMDIKMPIMDGYTAVKLIREKLPDIPIIAQTAYADDKTKAMEFGCSGFITKPFDKKSLIKIMTDHI
jgi:CheY-like chemotaxis protein